MDAAAAEEAAKKLPDGGTVKTLRSARIGNKDYATLAEAIAAAKDNDEILLLTDVQTSAYTKINKPLTINFGGKKMTSTDGGFDVYANVTLKNGTLESLKWGAWVQGGAKLNVESDMTIITTSTEGNKGGVTVQGQGSTVTVKGKITSAGGITVSGIGNKADGGVTINIEDGAVITNTNPEGLGVFFPNTEQLNIRGGTITGTTGVWVKSGNVSITGGTIIGTGTKREYEYKTEGGAGYPTGEALVIEKCRYPGGDPAVNITGGTFIAENADTAVGSYIGNGDTAPLEKFVNGGNYSSSLKDTPFLSDSLRAELKKSNGTAPFSYYPTYDAAKAEADANGGTVTDLRAISAVSASVTAPTKGTALATNVTLPADAKYTAAVQWFDEADPTTAVTGNAKGGKVYTAKITLTANAGESFAESLNGTTVDGYTVSYVNRTTLELTKTFDATQAAVLTGLEVTGYTGSTRSAGETISKDEVTVKATYDDGTENADYKDYEIAYEHGASLSRGDTTFMVRKDTVTAAHTFPNAVTGKTVTAELFKLTDPHLTFNGNDQIEAIRKAVSVKAEFAGKIGKITVTVKQADADVTDATNAGSYDVWVTCEAGSEYDALTTPMKIGSVILHSEAAGGGSSSVVPGGSIWINPVTGGSVTSANGSSAMPGSNVTLIVTPDRGYELGSLTVKDSRGNGLPLTDLGGGKYSFTMPEGRVSVDAAFRSMVRSFVDVLPSAYYYDAVRWAVGSGITSGTSGITFSPNAACTRAQVVTFLWRAAGSPKPASNVNSFADVPADAYYRDAVLWAVEQGITNGVSEGRFDPNATVTRGQTVAFLYRAAGSPAVSGGNTFWDVPGDSYYEKAVTWAYQMEITGGTSSSQFSPNAACTRAQIVTFLYRAQ